MITTVLKGGLGNQMFQYAFGRTIADRLGEDLAIDITSYKQLKKRKYELDCFPVRINKIITNSPSKLVSLIQSKFPITNVLFGRYYEEGFAKHIFSDNIGKNSKISGYWQDERYFLSNQNNIRKDFQFKNAFSEYYRSLQSSMLKSNSVSLHVRRGDYVTELDVNNTIGNLDIKYYIDSIDYIKSKVKKPKFFVFSDDIDWCIENFKKIDASIYFVSSKLGKPAEELNLMSQCKHVIIANSTFSWWGAWLNEYSNKMVIGPKNWYKDKLLNFQNHIIPKNWIKL